MCGGLLPEFGASPVGQASPENSVSVTFPVILNTEAPVLVAIAAASNRSVALAAGNYVVTADVDCYFIQGDSTVAATANSRRLWGKSYRSLYVGEEGDIYVAVIRASEDGTLSLEKID